METDWETVRRQLRGVPLAHHPLSFNKPLNLRDSIWPVSTPDELQQGVSDVISGLQSPFVCLPVALIGSQFLALTTPDEQEQLFRGLFRICTIRTLRLGEPRQLNRAEDLVSFDEFFTDRSLDGSDCTLCIQSFLQFLHNVPPWHLPSLQEFRMGDFALNCPLQISDFAEIVAQTLLPRARRFVIGPMYLTFGTRKQDCPLDPLLRSIASHMKNPSTLGIWGPIGHSTQAIARGRLVSHEVLEEFLIRYKSLRVALSPKPLVLALGALSLRDEDCTLITQRLSGSRVQILDLRYNPEISDAGCEMLGRLWDYNDKIHRIAVSDEHWDATFILLSCMNRMGRRQAVEDGMYENRKTWLQWLVHLAETIETFNGRFVLERQSHYWHNKHSDMALDALFLTVRSKPDFLTLYE